MDTMDRDAAGAAAAPAPADGGADICVIVNAGSGKQEAERGQAIERAFSPFAGRVAVHTVGRGGDIEAAAQKAIDDGFATVVAAGGDGTITAVAARLAGSGRRMAVLAFGTFNYFARSIGLPDDLDEAARVAIEGRPREFDVGDVNGRVFLNNASLGAYPAILQAREQMYQRWGRSRLAAYWSLLITLLGFRRPLRIRLTVDGHSRSLRTPLLFIAKNAHQLAEVGLEGGECVEVGKFAVFIAPDAGRLGLVIFALRLALGLSERREDFDLVCGSEVDVETAAPRRLVARDGERELMEGPFRFRLHRRALKVLVPPAEA